MIETDFLEELGRFSFMIKKKVSSVYAGTRRSLRQGKGIDVVDFREYQPGDDVKAVDWKLYGRTERLYIKRFEEEKSLTTHILVDASRSMAFGNPRKYDYAGMVALGFAYLVTKENEKFAVATYSEGLRETLSPDKGKGHLSRSLDLLENTELKGTTDLLECAERYAPSIRSRSLVIIISDFLEPLDNLRRGISLFSKGAHELILVQVLDPMELSLGDLAGDLKLHDMESGEVMQTYVSPRLREEYLHRLEEHVHAVKRACHGGKFYSMNTSTPIFEAFLEMVG